MKKIILSIILTWCFCTCLSAQPKKHVYYDTVKTVQQRVDYSPDTIPVFFKEVVIIHKAGIEENGGVYANDSAIEKLTPGYIIWQTYNKNQVSHILVGNSTFAASISQEAEYYTDEYHDNSLREKFLYLDKKPVTNKVIYAIKR